MTRIVNAIVKMAIFLILSPGLEFISIWSATSESLKAISYRLPDNVIPNSYEIKFVPDMSGKVFAFHGEAKINITVKKFTKSITLHAKYLDVSDSIQLQCYHEENPSEIFNISMVRKFVDDPNDFLILYVAQRLSPGSQCYLTLNFNTTNRDSSTAFEISQDMDSEKSILNIVMTHFELIYARQAFPCWDEPAFKANFIISIEHDKEYIALSNMPMERQESDPSNPSRVTTYFAKSPKMSTYLVAFAVGDMAKAINDSSGNFTVWARKGVSTNGIYAQQIGPEILKSLQNYMNYTLEMQGLTKVDVVAMLSIQRYYTVGNWGLITDSQLEIFSDENFTSITGEDNTLNMIVEKLSHQWVGNLVSVSWWDDLWVQKGLAYYLAPIISDQIRPSWRKKDRFVIENLQKLAFDMDNTIYNDYVINRKWFQPHNEVIFEHENFKKAACIIRMISHVLGEKKFQDRIRHLVKTHAFKSFTSDEFLMELADGDEKIMGFMNNWFNVPGFPVITVTRNYEEETATISQSRYVDENEMSSEKYWIPLNYVTQDRLDFNNTKVTHWLHPLDDSKEITQLDEDQFVIFNKQQFGYYRVNYDEKNWRMIAEYLRTKNFSDIHPLNRAQLINDAFKLAKVGQLKYDVALTLIEYLEQENDLIVWAAVLSSTKDVEMYLRSTEFIKPFKDYLLNLSRHIMEKLVSNEDDPIISLYKNEFLFRFCSLGSDLCPTKRAVEEFEKRQYNNFPAWVSCSISRIGDEKKLYEIWENFVYGTRPDIFKALECMNNITFHKELLSRTYVEREHIASGLLPFLQAFEYLAPEKGIDALLDFMIVHYEELLETYVSQSARYNELMIRMARKLKNRHQLSKILKFSKTLAPSTDIDLNYILKIVNNNVEDIEKRSDEFREFFSESSTEILPSQRSVNDGKEIVNLNIGLFISTVLLAMVTAFSNFVLESY